MVFEESDFHRRHALENYGTVNCANQQHAWHEWHTGKTTANQSQMDRDETQIMESRDDW